MCHSLVSSRVAADTLSVNRARCGTRSTGPMRGLPSPLVGGNYEGIAPAGRRRRLETIASVAYNAYNAIMPADTGKKKAWFMAIPHLQGLIFDWDGTIVDSARAMFLSYRHAYKKHLGITFPRDDADFRRLVPMRLAESSARYGGTRAAEVAASYNWYYAAEGYKTG